MVPSYTEAIATINVLLLHTEKIVKTSEKCDGYNMKAIYHQKQIYKKQPKYRKKSEEQWSALTQLSPL